jgi:hypothetical protein
MAYVRAACSGIPIRRSASLQARPSAAPCFVRAGMGRSFVGDERSPFYPNEPGGPIIAPILSDTLGAGASGCGRVPADRVRAYGRGAEAGPAGFVRLRPPLWPPRQPAAAVSFLPSGRSRRPQARPSDLWATHSGIAVGVAGQVLP